MIEARIILTGLLAAYFAAGIAGAIVRTPPALESRLRPYVQLRRTRLGQRADVNAALAIDSTADFGPFRRIFNPIVEGFAGLVARLVDSGDEATVAQRLRQAGLGHISPREYRISQAGRALLGTVGGVLGGLWLGAVWGSASFWAVVGMALGIGWGFTSSRGRINKAIEGRTRTMRLELYTISHLLAMLVRANHTPAMAVRQITDRGRGPVVEELREAQKWVAGGLTLAQAMERLSAETPEPAAGRIYRILGEASQQGSDVSESLMTVAHTLRAERREEVERLGTKRRGAMIVPTLVVMAPVVFLYVVAPIPRFVFGS